MVPPPKLGKEILGLLRSWGGGRPGEQKTIGNWIVILGLVDRGNKEQSLNIVLLRGKHAIFTATFYCRK